MESIPSQHKSSHSYCTNYNVQWVEQGKRTDQKVLNDTKFNKSKNLPESLKMDAKLFIVSLEKIWLDAIISETSQSQKK